MKEDLLKIINNYGVIHQLKHFNSEVFELTEAIIIREQEESPSSYTDKLEEHIAEEIADCLVMINQFIEYYGIDNNDVCNIMQQKVNRQLERMKEEK